jgi:hypothetical protein
MDKKNIKFGKVILTMEEVQFAKQIALQRDKEAKAKGLQDKHGLNKEDALYAHTIGALGELAFCKKQQIVWPAHVNTFKNIPDVNEFEIRTGGQSWYDLLVRNDDDDNAPFVLVRVIKYPQCLEVVGWLYGAECKKRKWLKDYGKREPAYFVPSQVLRK